MKYIKLFEAFMSYDDLSRKGGWGSPSDIEEDLRMTVINLMRYGNVSDRLKDIEFEDQSSDKGVKWEIVVSGKGDDIIHAYKDDKWRGQYKWFLNKKKSSTNDIQKYFLDKYTDQLEQYIASMKAFDFHYQMADGAAYKKGLAHAEELRKLYDSLSSSDKKKAHLEFTKLYSSKQDFKSFKGA